MNVIDPPDSIWLVYGDLDDDTSHRECCESGEVTWCDHAVFDSDVQYVRKDILDNTKSEIDWKFLACLQLAALAAVAKDEYYPCQCGIDPYIDGEPCPKCFAWSQLQYSNKVIERIEQEKDW